MTEPLKPADRQPKQLTEKERKEVMEAAAAQLAAGLDLSPLTVDMKDGEIWAFKADLLPSDMAKLRDAATAFQEANEDASAMEAAFNMAVDALRSLLVDEKQRDIFPLQSHGIRAVSFLLGVVSQGKSGLPTAP